MGKMNFKGSFLLIIFLFSSQAICQEKKLETIKFKVEESKNNPLPGVSIYVKGTLIETSTDFEGEAFLDLHNNNQTILLRFLVTQFSFKLKNNVDFVYIDLASRRVSYFKNGEKIKTKKLMSDSF
jgi:hypothetical protein